MVADHCFGRETAQGPAGDAVEVAALVIIDQGQAQSIDEQRSRMYLRPPNSDHIGYGKMSGIWRFSATIVASKFDSVTPSCRTPRDGGK